MKFIHLSDAHLVQPGASFMGSDPLQRLKCALRDITTHHADADALVITGDLSETGGIDTYLALKDAIHDMPMPVRLLLGNHDIRANFATVFPEFIAENGFAQSCLDIGSFRLIFLDTLETGEVNGVLCDARLSWLEKAINDASGSNILVFMHHPPGRVHLPALDAIGLNEADRFFSTLKAHPKVRRIFAGHYHRLTQGEWFGIPFSILRSTNHQTALDFLSHHTSNSFEAPLYSITIIDDESSVTHFHEYPLADRAAG